MHLDSRRYVYVGQYSNCGFSRLAFVLIFCPLITDKLLSLSKECDKIRNIPLKS